MQHSGQDIRQRRQLWILIAAAGLIRIVYLLWYSSLPEWSILTVDNYYHLNWARDIASGNVAGDTTYFRAPGYIWLLAVLFTVSEASIWVARVAGLAIGVGTTTLTYLLGKRLADHRAGLFGAALYAVYPLSIYFEMELLLDPLFTLLLVAAVLGYFRWDDHRDSKSAAFAGLLLGLATITRPTALVLYPLFLLMMLLRVKPGSGSLRQAAIWLLVALLPIGITLVRNMTVADDPVLVSAQGGINFYIGNNASADGLTASLPEPMGHNWEIRQISHIAEAASGTELHPGEVSTYWGRRALKWISENPGEFVMLTAKKSYYSLGNREVSNNRNLAEFADKIPLLGWNPLRFWLLLFLAVIGAVAAYRADGRMIAVVLVVVIYILAMSVFFFSSRFRLPLIPFYAVLAGYGLQWIIEAVRWKAWTKRHNYAVATAIVFAAISLFPAEPSSHSGDPQSLTSHGHYYYHKDDLPQALQYYRSALEVDSSFPENNLNVGVAYFRLGRADSALKYFEREIALHPDRHKAYTNVASMALLDGQYTDALQFARAALDRAPYDETAWTLYLRAYIEDPDRDARALEPLIDSAATATDSNVVLLYDIGVRLAENASSDEALFALKTAAASSPPPIETNDAAFRPGFEDPRNRQRRYRALSFSQMAAVSGRMEAYRQAIEYGLKAVEIDPGLVEGYINLASAYSVTGRLRHADSVLSVALERFPDDERLIRLKGYFK